MNDDNKEFIKNFQQRVSNYPEYDKIVSKVDEQRNEIVSKIDKTIKFLNDDVLATGTSSLIRTEIDITKSEGSWDNGKEVITFNHKGIGSIRLAEQNKYTYGTNFSKELNTKKFLRVLSDDVIRQTIIDELIKIKSIKILKRFNDICSTTSELKEMATLSEKYKDVGISYTFKEPQIVFKPRMEVDENNVNYIKLESMSVERISLLKNNKFSVHITMTPEEMEENEKNRPSYQRGYGDINEIMFETSDIITSMFLMQFPDEVKIALDSINNIITKDYERLIELSSTVNTKLAEYAVIASLKE